MLGLHTHRPNILGLPLHNIYKERPKAFCSSEISEEALRSKSKTLCHTQTLSQSNRPTHKNQRDLPQFLRPTSLLNKSLHKPYKVALHFRFKFAHLLIITNP
ncbi:hypothetical protein L2E82_39795 [Cichorium intybus]|uniref:Uncharacterized protein n=1 Tax=Cichorium intybus TaxID=13427 RepID=A0ACB9AJH8_CICIN|nr:hypothetical protein L2E82_39795 [Cichorium intybus]